MRRLYYLKFQEFPKISRRIVKFIRIRDFKSKTDKVSRERIIDEEVVLFKISRIF